MKLIFLKFVGIFDSIPLEFAKVNWTPALSDTTQPHSIIIIDGEKPIWDLLGYSGVTLFEIPASSRSKSALECCHKKEIWIFLRKDGTETKKTNHFFLKIYFEIFSNFKLFLTFLKQILFEKTWKKQLLKT